MFIVGIFIIYLHIQYLNSYYLVGKFCMHYVIYYQSCEVGFIKPSPGVIVRNVTKQKSNSFNKSLMFSFSSGYFFLHEGIFFVELKYCGFWNVVCTFSDL